MDSCQQRVEALLGQLAQMTGMSDVDRANMKLDSNGRCSLVTETGTRLTLEASDQTGLLVVYVKVGVVRDYDSGDLLALLEANFDSPHLKLAHYGVDSVTRELYIRYFYPVELLGASELEYLLANLINIAQMQMQN